MRVFQVFTWFLGVIFVMIAPVSEGASLCHVDCDAWSEFRYPCPSWSQPGRTCEGHNPVLRYQCLVTQTAACQVDDAVGGMSQWVSERVLASVGPQARAEGWNKATCMTTSSAAILLPAAHYIAPLCSASGFITGGIGVPACVAAVSGAIVGATCTLLCKKGYLDECS